MTQRHGVCSVCEMVVDLDQYGRVGRHFNPKDQIQFTNFVTDPSPVTQRRKFCIGTGETPWGSA
jgi:hypothetical protein